MEVEVAEPQSTKSPPSTLSFCPEGPFLAAGSMDSYNPKLRILRSTPGAYLFDPVASFWSPAPLRRVCWSDAFSSGSSRSLAGLIAGGLDNGSVVVWDPHKQISDWSASEYDAGEMELKTRLELGADEFRTRGHNFSLIDNYIGQSELRKPSPPLLDKATNNLTPSTGAAHSVVASLRPSFPAQRGPVRALEFSPCSPTLLASGSKDGLILVWDIANMSAPSVPTYQHITSPSLDISSLCWSKFLPNLIAYTSSGGTTSIVDLSSEASPVSRCDCMRRCSSVEFSPANENLLLLACNDAFDTTSLMEFDLRKIKEPLVKFCEGSEGVSAMSWSQWNHLVVTTNNRKVLVWDMNEKMVIAEKHTESRCFDVHWNKTSEDTFFAKGTSGRSFVAASNEKLHMYQVDNIPLIT